MSANTAIQWCDDTVNPTMGCNGCELWNANEHTCYAGAFTERMKGKKGYPKSFTEPERFEGRMLPAALRRDLQGEERADKPWLNGFPRLIFVSDMGDALSREIPFDYLETEIIDTVTSFSGCRHLWIWLTKRPERMADFADWLKRKDVLWPDNLIAATSIIQAASAAARIKSLKRVSSRFKALSVEPLWEPVDLDLHGIDWAIVGGESAQRKLQLPGHSTWTGRVGFEMRLRKPTPHSSSSRPEAMFWTPANS